MPGTRRIAGSADVDKEESPEIIVINGDDEHGDSKKVEGGGNWARIANLMRRHAAGIIFCIPLVSTMIVLIRILVDRRRQTFEGTKLHRDVETKSIEMVTAEYGLLIMSVPFLLVLAWNVLELRTNWSNAERLKRVDMYGRILILLGMCVPATILFGIFSSLNEGAQDDQRRDLINAACFTIIFANNLVGFFILSSILVRIVHAEDPFMRPILCIVLAVGDAGYSIINVVTDVDIGQGRDQPILQSLAQALSSARYAVIALGFLSLINIARNRFFFGTKMPFRALDLVFGPTMGISLFVLSRVLSSTNHAAFYGSTDLSAGEWSSFEVLKTAYIIALLLFSLFFLTRVVAANWEDLRISEQKLDIVQTLTHRLQQEKALTVKLMSSMMPARIADNLSKGIAVPPEMYKYVVVFFSDIEGFTKFSRQHQPIIVFDMLDRLYSVMDLCVSQFPSLYKVETIGDAYMVVGGLLQEDGDDDGTGGDDWNDPITCDESRSKTANDVCQFALIVNEAARTVPLTPYTSNVSFVNIRIGVHAGECVAGLTGSINPRFCLFGDTVNFSSRMESTGVTRRIHTSQSFASFVSSGPFSKLYHLEQRPELVDIKGLGRMQTYFLEPAPSFDVYVAYAELFAEIAEMQGGGGGGGGAGLPIQQQAQEQQARAVISRYLSTKHQGGGGDEAAARATKQQASPEPKPHLPKSLSTSFIDMPLDLSYATCPFPFETLVQPDFDVLQLRAADDASLCVAIMELFRGLVGQLAAVRVKDITFERFLWSCRARYRDVPYHNFFHSFCVVQFAASLLHVFARAPLLLPKEDLFLVLLAALVHDIDHRGLNNAFHINSGSSLALVYNDSSPLENHHAATTFRLLRLDNVLEKWKAADVRRARHLLISCVMATDMKQHGSLTDALLKRSSQDPCFVLSADADRVAFAELVLHAADISNAVRPFCTSRSIVHDLAREFALQVAEETRLGMPSLPFMILPDERAVAASETGFLSHCARPYFVALQACFDRLPQPQPQTQPQTQPPSPARRSVGALVAVLDDNVVQWAAIRDAAQPTPSGEDGNA